MLSTSYLVDYVFVKPPYLIGRQTGRIDNVDPFLHLVWMSNNVQRETVFSRS